MKPSLYLYIFSTIFLFLACSDNRDSKHVDMSLNDSILHRAKTYVYSGDMQKLDSARVLCESLLESDINEEKSQLMFDALGQLIAISHLQHNDEQCLKWTSLLAERCREREGEVEASSARKSVILSVAALVFVLAGFVSLYYRRQRLAISEKNRALVKQISDAAEYKNKYWELKNSIQQNGASSPLVALSLQEDENNGNSDEAHRQLFVHLRELIVKEQLYLDPSFGRQTLIDRFGFTKERVGAAFAKGSSYGSLASFINECRLVHGVNLLVHRPDLSIEQVAHESGFANANTFGRNFKTKFSMSPTDYREFRSKDGI